MDRGQIPPRTGTLTIHRSGSLIATEKWLSSSAAGFQARDGHTGMADLLHYNAQFCEWGSGQPLVLIPGLAGGFDLLGPLTTSHASLSSRELPVAGRRRLLCSAPQVRSPRFGSIAHRILD